MKNEIINIFANTWPTIAIVGCIILIMRITYIIKSERKSFTLYEEVLNLCFFIYLILLFQLVSSQEISGGGSNFVPFKEILRYKYGTIGFNKQVVGNILLFIPLGFYISKYCKLKSIWSIMLVSFLSSVCIESVQHFIGRCVDVDDVILNVIGGILGFLIYVALNAIKNHLPRFLRKNWFYNLICILIIAIMAICVYNIF